MIAKLFFFREGSQTVIGLEAFEVGFDGRVPGTSSGDCREIVQNNKTVGLTLAKERSECAFALSLLLKIMFKNHNWSNRRPLFTRTTTICCCFTRISLGEA